MRPVVSVCIANYNGIGLIDACIASVYAQDAQFLVEIIIHDDASTDGSAANIRSRYPDVTLIESTDNVGFCIANNRMAEIAQGEYLLLLNNDAALMSDALRTLHAEATHLTRSAILGLPQFDFDSGDLIDRGCLLDPFFNPVPNLDPERQDVALTIGACLWIPKQLWSELGGFPEWFGSIAEDLYLCCRSRLAGHPVRVCANSGYQHRVGRSFGGGKAQGGRLSTTYRRRALSERNKTFAMLITSPGPIVHLIFPLHITALISEGILVFMFRLDSTLWRKVYFACLAALWRERKRLRYMRNIVQSQRTIAISRFYCPFDWWPYKLRMLRRYGVPEVR